MAKVRMYQRHMVKAYRRRLEEEKDALRAGEELAMRRHNKTGRVVDNALKGCDE